MASRTASAPWPASAGPFVALGPPWPIIGGRCSSIVKRVLRSTSVPIAELPRPRIRSPSQCPGTARSCASAGRSLIRISSVTKLLPRPRVRSRDAQRPPGPQARGELAPQRAAALHIERLVDRLVGDPHRLIIGELKAEPASDLLRAPRPRPTPILAATVTPTNPPHIRTSHRAPTRPLHGARKTVLHVPSQLAVDDKLRRLRAPTAPVSVPLRGRGPILEPATTSRGIATKLPRDSRGRTAEHTRGLTHATPAGAQQRDLLPLSKRQIASRQRGLLDQRHPATLTKPPDTNRRRHARLHGRILARQTASDRRPEPLSILTASNRRTTRRVHRCSPRTIRSTPLRQSHRKPLSVERCDDHLNPPNTPRSTTPRRSTITTCWRRSDRSATPTTTRCRGPDP